MAVVAHLIFFVSCRVFALTRLVAVVSALTLALTLGHRVSPRIRCTGQEIYTPRLRHTAGPDRSYGHALGSGYWRNGFPNLMRIGVPFLVARDRDPALPRFKAKTETKPVA